MPKTLRYLIAVVVAATPSALFAESFTLDCVREFVDTSAYVDSAAADSWHPKQATLRVEDRDVYYDGMRGAVRIEGSRYKFEFVFADIAVAAGASYNITVTYIPRTGRFVEVVSSPGGYMQGAGSGGRCVQR